jgi:hypothetical protein
MPQTPDAKGSAWFWVIAIPLAAVFAHLNWNYVAPQIQRYPLAFGAVGAALLVFGGWRAWRRRRDFSRGEFQMQLLVWILFVAACVTLIARGI